MNSNESLGTSNTPCARKRLSKKRRQRQNTVNELTFNSNKSDTAANNLDSKTAAHVQAAPALSKTRPRIRKPCTITSDYYSLNKDGWDKDVVKQTMTLSEFGSTSAYYNKEGREVYDPKTTTVVELGGGHKRVDKCEGLLWTSTFVISLPPIRLTPPLQPANLRECLMEKKHKR